MKVEEEPNLKIESMENERLRVLEDVKHFE